MIAGLEPYPAMKDSGVPWLGEVPEHWEVQRGKWLFRHRKQINSDHGNTNVLSLTLRGVVNNDPENPEGLVPKDYTTYQLFSKDDLVFKLIDLENLRTSRVGLVHEDGIMSSAYVRLVPEAPVDIRFFFQQYFDLYQRGIYNQLGAGVRSTLGPNDLLNLSMVLPPLPEQVAIVHFLDHADRRIRRYIRAKQKLIGLLEEQKQAIIHRAVTRGVDPDVRLKPSGVEWLGEVPEHWKIERVKRLARPGSKTFTDGDWIELPYITDGGVRLIQTGNVGPGEYREKGFRYVSEQTFTELGCTEVCAGDVLICRLDGPVGRACLAPNLGCRAITSVDNTILKVGSNVDPRFVVYCLSSPGWLDWIQSLCRAGGGFRYRISRSTLGDLQLAMPGLPEQRQIADHLDQWLLGIRESIAGERRATELLREFRTRLIADVVTGKLDVRELAAQLPVEAAAPAPETEEIDEARDESDLEVLDEELEAV